ncbi:MAG: hypothetical protein P1V29_09590 [Gammaproteobacteria bacterium]|jgi:hypothetical protein|nr:hypothetical protein [Gammaproteobacteria bacterium]
MKDEEWDEESSDDVEAFDASEIDDSSEDDSDQSSSSMKRNKTDVTDLRRRIEDRLESKRLRETYYFDDDDFDDDFDTLLDRLG